jgi:hypothetical protein
MYRGRLVNYPFGNRALSLIRPQSTLAALRLFDWLPIRPDGVGVVWATRQPDWKPRLDDSLNDLFGFWRRFRVACLPVVPDDALLLRQFLQRLSKRFYRGRCSVDRDAPVSHYGYLQSVLGWLLLSQSANRGHQNQENAGNCPQHAGIIELGLCGRVVAYSEVSPEPLPDS